MGHTKKNIVFELYVLHSAMNKFISFLGNSVSRKFLCPLIIILLISIFGRIETNLCNYAYYQANLVNSSTPPIKPLKKITLIVA